MSINQSIYFPRSIVDNSVLVHTLFILPSRLTAKCVSHMYDAETGKRANIKKKIILVSCVNVIVLVSWFLIYSLWEGCWWGGLEGERK